MPKAPPQPDTLFHRPALLQEITARINTASAAPTTADALRQHALDILSEAHGRGRETIHRRFTEHHKASRAIRETAWLMDELLLLLTELATTWLLKQKKPSGFCIAAVGGYGRQKLFAHSDIDLLFLHRPQARARTETVTEFILYSLWDMQLSVGQSLRTVEETIAQSRDDITTRTNMMDARFICGSKKLFGEFTDHFHDELLDGHELEFIQAKMEEREHRHQRWGDSRYVLEPNVKEGKGGLRDLQTLYWIARGSYGIRRISELGKLGLLTATELRTFRKAAEFFYTVRLHLHQLSGRAEERLTFDMQRSIAEAMGYREQGPNQAVERFMKRYFMMTKEVGNLTRIFCTVLEAEQKFHAQGFLRTLLTWPRKLEGFVLEGSRLDFPEEYAIVDDPVSLLRLFHVAQQHQLDIHPRALQRVSRNLKLIGRELRHNAEATRLFTEMLLAEERSVTALRRMNDAGVLGRFIPDFGRVVGQMQFDMYHVYSVDEHILTALSILQEIARGALKDELPLTSELIATITQRGPLILAVLCHDIAKGRGGNHAEKGASIVQKLARRLGFSAQEQHLAGWLVRHHALLSDTAFKRDLNDPETIRRLAELLKTPERLRLLLLITVVDIRAVGPGIWNGWKGALLRDLYYRVEAWMGTREPDAPVESQAAIRQHLASAIEGWNECNAEAYLALGAPAYWGMLDLETHARLAPIILSLQHQPASDTFEMLHTVDSFRSITELLLCLRDRHGLFALMTGVMAMCGANIQHAKIFTLKNGVAVERFGLQDWHGEAFDMTRKESQLRESLAAALSGTLDLATELARVRETYPRPLEPFAFAPGIVFNNTISATHTVIEITAIDTIGLLHTISQVLSDHHLSIATAHITTYGEQAVDVFYVKDPHGNKITHDDTLHTLRTALLDALSL